MKSQPHYLVSRYAILLALSGGKSISFSLEHAYDSV
jgi:hypothetical protein